MATGTNAHIPTCKGWPLLGVLPNLLRGDPYQYLKSIMLEQGDLVRLNIAAKPCYLVSSPDCLQYILRDNYKNYRKPELLYNVSREIIGDGLVVSSGDAWLRQRRMIQPLFNRKRLEGLYSGMVDAVAEALQRWESPARSGLPVDLGQKLGDLTLNVVVNTMFGRGTLPPAEFTEVGQRIMRLVEYTGATLYSSLLPRWFPVPGRRQFLDDLSALRRSVKRIITTSRREDSEPGCLIRMLINSVDEESHAQMTERQIFDEVMTIILAGYDTSLLALTWLTVILQSHREVAQRLCGEIDQVLGGRTPSFEDIPRLGYTRRVFMEILRMYTIVPFLPRALNEADQLGSHSLPANSLVLMFFHGVHHNPRVWDRPEVFDPGRFTPEQTVSRHPFAYLPFSGGPRKCVGDNFALLEGTLTMAMMLQKFSIKVLPDQTFAAKLGGTMAPRDGVKAVLSLRVQH